MTRARAALAPLRPLLARVAPPYSRRRLVLSVVRDPARARSRLSPGNLRDWRTFTRQPMSCNVCGHVGRAYYSLPDPTEEELYRCPVRRETLQCHGCGCTMRTRTLAAGLLDLMADRYGVRADTVEQLAERWPSGVRVLDTETGSVLNDRLAGLPGYLQSVYLDGRVSGERVAEGVVNVDLQSMPFPDASFDLIITTEVMEHVRHVDVAHREIARCLAPGGSYLFTVPYDHTFARTWVLIDPVTDEPLVLPMHLHGDPLRGQIKSYRVFGRDLVDDLRAAGLDARLLRLDRPSVGVFGGDVFVAERVARPLQIDLTDGREAAEVRQGRPA